MTSSTVDSPDLVRKQLHPAVPKPDTPRPPSRSGSKGGRASASGGIKELSEGGEGRGSVLDAAAAAVVASTAEGKRDTMREEELEVQRLPSQT